MKDRIHLDSLLMYISAAASLYDSFEGANLIVITIDSNTVANIYQKDNVIHDKVSLPLTNTVRIHNERWETLFRKYCNADKCERLAMRIHITACSEIKDVGVFKYEGSDPPLIDWEYKDHDLDFVIFNQKNINDVIREHQISLFNESHRKRNTTEYSKDVKIEISDKPITLETVYTDETLKRIEAAIASIPEELALDITFIKQHDVNIPRDNFEVEQGYLGTFNIVPRRQK